jgi:tRNA-splicing ligase RtcB (3'-phosphate/5'-hydroxy nucleic acid ligase)
MAIDVMDKPGQLVPVKLWTPIQGVESAALAQLSNVAKMPWVFHHVAVMPDVHSGKGATVGSVIAMKEAVSPATVGVDIGCGMGAVKTSLRASDLPDSLHDLRIAVEAAIPVGFMKHDEPAFKGSSPEAIKRSGQWLFSEFRNLPENVQSLLGNAKRQVGTLGGGNHFIEVSLGDDGSDPHVWLVLHSGSRNIGKVLAEHHIHIAKKLIHNQALPDPDLAVFLANTPQMETYLADLMWAQEYAFFNRQVMFELLKQVMFEHFPQVKFMDQILCHHNYVSQEFHFGEEVLVTRKGAISAQRGERGIIPGSMGTKSFIVRGLGNAESFHSASHGAGRRMSRSQAKKKFTVEDLAQQTEGVESRKDQGVVDEIPGAYKDIDQVMANQSDLVEIETTLKQVLCVKG